MKLLLYVLICVEGVMILVVVSVFHVGTTVDVWDEVLVVCDCCTLFWDVDLYVDWLYVWLVGLGVISIFVLVSWYVLDLNCGLYEIDMEICGDWDSYVGDLCFCGLIWCELIEGVWVLGWTMICEEL